MREPIRIPGFVNAHVHIESSHLTPAEFGKLMFRRGTTVAICDPHEIVNVLGEEGLRFMLEDAKGSPCELLFELPSCVPATGFETSGAVLTASDTAELFDRYPELIGLGEMMNAPGVIHGDPEVLGKIRAAKERGKIVEGHFPCGRGAALKQYASAGITSDHETITPEEALEKLACGMTIFLREGSSAKNLKDLIGIVTRENVQSFCFCTDDISAADLMAEGGILRCVRMAISLGLAPELALQIACENPRRYFHLREDPGTYVLIDNMEELNIIEVVKNGHKYS